jgi:hypothetical protein
MASRPGGIASRPGGIASRTGGIASRTGGMAKRGLGVGSEEARIAGASLCRPTDKNFSSGRQVATMDGHSIPDRQ